MKLTHLQTLAFKKQFLSSLPTSHTKRKLFLFGENSNLGCVRRGIVSRKMSFPQTLRFVEIISLKIIKPDRQLHGKLTSLGALSGSKLAFQIFAQCLAWCLAQ